MSMPAISVVVPCRNGVATIGRQLDSLLGQSEELTYEVVVADNGSTDGTVELVRRYSDLDPRVRVVDASHRAGINVARNAGVRGSRGQYVLMCDADDVVHPGWLPLLAAALAGGAGCVGGAVRRTLPSGEQLDVHDGAITVEGTSLRSPLGANCGFRREVFYATGGFDETFAGGSDEIDFFWRAQQSGYRLVFVPDAVIRYMVRSGAVAVWRQYFRYGRGEVRLYLKHRQHGMKRPRLIGSLKAVARSAMQLSFSKSTADRRAALESLAVRVGRFAESLATRTLYL